MKEENFKYENKEFYELDKSVVKKIALEDFYIWIPISEESHKSIITFVSIHRIIEFVT